MNLTPYLGERVVIRGAYEVQLLDTDLRSTASGRGTGAVRDYVTTVRVTVMTLRRKLGEPAVIVTVPGSGYRI